METIRSEEGSPEAFDVDQLMKGPDVLTINKDCASCHGFAPQILQHLKVACLPYINSQIK